MSGTLARPKTEMELMGITNSYWGVCGFTSTFHSVYEHNPGKRGLVIGSQIPTRVLADIKIYLTMLKAAGNFALLKEIEKFTRTFPRTKTGYSFSSFTIDNYITMINAAVGKTDKEITGNPGHSIGMPPVGVADYVARMWGGKPKLNRGENGADGIIGVKKDSRKLYDGLCHWMYRSNGKIYSWGQYAFNSVTEADSNYKVIWVIETKF